MVRGRTQAGEEDLKKAIEANENKKKKIVELEQEIENREKELSFLIDPIRKKILAERVVEGYSGTGRSQTNSRMGVRW